MASIKIYLIGKSLSQTNITNSESQILQIFRVGLFKLISKIQNGLF
jgi:hypothetical protein